MGPRHRFLAKPRRSVLGCIDLGPGIGLIVLGLRKKCVCIERERERERERGGSLQGLSSGYVRVSS